MMKNKPCPFCGMNELSMFMDNIEDEYWVLCGSCYAEGPSSNTLNDAWFVWNIRPEAINENIKLQG